MRMMRRVTFSAGHRYWRQDWDEARNREVYGPWASRFNHGHNYTLDVTVEGPVDSVTGMIVNIKRVDDILKERVVSRFDGRSINDEIPEFATRSTTTESLLSYFAEVLGPTLQVDRYIGDNSILDPVTVTNLRLAEMPTFFGEMDMTQQSISLTRVYEFAAAHRLHAPELSEAENERLFGKCHHAHGHGHNYTLEVTVSGPIDPVTGMMADLGALDDVVDMEILDRYDHRNLDVDIPELTGRVTTSENVAQAIFDRLAPRTPAPLVRIRLWETARNCFEVTAASPLA